jgi:amidase
VVGGGWLSTASVRGVPDEFDTFQTALATAAAIKKREVSPLEVLDACLARVDALNDRLNVVIWRNDEEARDAARVAGDVVVNSDASDLPPFHGVPIPIKDLNPVAGWPVTYGSWGARDAPSETSELVVRAFQDAGFLLTGRTNTPEFGLLLVAENDRYGISRNPWDLDRTPGGSTGASAAVAGGLFPLAHGGDGAGSIRVPASCCGLVGLKVSRGRVPTLVSHWEGAAVQGVLTHDVADTAAVLDVISRPDPLQWYNAPSSDRSFLSDVRADPGRLRVGVLEEAPFGLPVDQPCIEAVRQAAAALEKLGHHVDLVSYQVPDDFVVALFNIVNSGLAGFDVDWEKTEPHVRTAHETAQAVDSLTYVRSVQDLQRWSREFVARWGHDFDLLVTPTMSIEPPRAGEVLAAAHEAKAPPLPAMQMAAFCVGFNISGQPAISLPTHVAPSGLPIGVQLVAGPWEEALLLRVAAQLEEALPWAGRRPPL